MNFFGKTLPQNYVWCFVLCDFTVGFFEAAPLQIATVEVMTPSTQQITIPNLTPSQEGTYNCSVGDLYGIYFLGE